MKHMYIRVERCVNFAMGNKPVAVAVNRLLQKCP